jgi:hypothetical protein
MFGKSAGNRRESTTPDDTQEFTLPSNLRGDYSWIGAQSIATFGDIQYAVWVGADRKARIARRLFNREWETSIDLSAQSGSVLTADFDLDSHNTIVVHVDVMGYVHIAGNMHADPLLYMRSTSPGVLTAWTSGMVGTLESSATYPQFITAKNGVTYFFYRDGSSGDGDWVLNKCSNVGAIDIPGGYPAGRDGAPVWTRVAVVLQGSVENVNAYPHNIAVNPTTGRWHMVWTIRKDFSSDAENENIYAAYSDDDGVTWKKYSDGSSYTLPITWASGEVVQALVGGAGGGPILKNGGSTSLDTSGYPQSVWLLESGVSTGVYYYKLLAWNGSAWAWTSPFGTTNSSGRVPALHIWPDGRRWMFFQNGAGGRGNTLRYLDLDASTETAVRNVSMIHHTPVVHYSRARGAVYVFAPYERQDGAELSDPADLADQPDVPIIALL